MSQTQKFTRIITRQNKRDVMTLAWEVVGKLLEAHESICIEVREKNRTLEQFQHTAARRRLNTKLTTSLVIPVEKMAEQN